MQRIGMLDAGNYAYLAETDLYETPAHPTYPVPKVTLYVERTAGQVGEVTFGGLMALDLDVIQRSS